MNLANKLTIVRMLMIPIFMLCFYLPVYGDMLAWILFTLAYLTDLLDGYIARSRNQVTVFGKFMDPMADKLLTMSAMVMLSAAGRISPIATIIVIGREFAVSSLRLLAANDGVVVSASWMGKVKTVSQFVAILLVLMGNPIFSLWHFPMDQIAIWISVAFTVSSGIDYFKAYGKYININE